ncbi:transposase, partial [Glaesserella parasuis]
RDWSPFVANDIWIGDGHSLKLKVAHPVHGRPFTPELTMIADGASRKIVGWSLSLSENAFAVLDALRHGIATHGVPAIYYSDNGGGEKNKILDAEVTGILPRFSIHHATGIAGNPQGRGIIERLNKTVGLRIAE